MWELVTYALLARVKRTTYFNVDSYITVVFYLRVATPFLTVDRLGDFNEFHMWCYGDTILTSDSLQPDSMDCMFSD